MLSALTLLDYKCSRLQDVRYSIECWIKAIKVMFLFINFVIYFFLRLPRITPIDTVGKNRAWGHIHSTSFSLQLTNAPNKLECFSMVNLPIQVICNDSSLLGTFICYEENEVLWIHIPGSIFAILHFLCNLQTVSMNLRVTLQSALKTS